MPKLLFRGLFRTVLIISVVSFMVACSADDDGNNEQDVSGGDADAAEVSDDTSGDSEDGSVSEFPTGAPCPEDCPFFNVGGSGAQIVECSDCEDGFCASSEQGDEVCTIPCDSTAECEEIGTSSQCEMVGDTMACSYGDGT